MSLRLRSLLLLIPMMFLFSGVALEAASAAPSPATQVNRLASSSSTITISLYAFSVPASVPAGSTVTVVNKDAVAHTVTATGGAFNVPAPANSTTSFTAPSTPGSYAFICTIHPGMKGTLVVVSASGPPPGHHHPTGPVGTGDGGSITGPNTALEATGIIALIGAGAMLVLWRRSAARR
jgi:plastocyanin